MARKSESISDKIVRLYKDGYNIEEISKMMEMSKSVVPNILEKHMPDYKTFIQPEREHNIEEGEKPTKRGVLGTPVSELFKKKLKKDNDLTSQDDEGGVTINLEMDENGFVENSVSGMASMLQKGRNPKDVADFFNRSVADIKAVSEVMDEHFARKDAAEASKPVNEFDGPEVIKSANLLSGESPIKVSQPKVAVATYTAPTYTKPVESEPASVDDIVSSANAIDDNYRPLEMPELDGPETIPELEIPSLDTIESVPKKTVTVLHDEIPDAVIPGITSDIVKEDESTMSPMEKMRKFAEEQIEVNKGKLSELKAKEADARELQETAVSKLDDLKAKAEESVKLDNEYTSKIAELNAQIAQLNSQILEINDKHSVTTATLAEIKSEQDSLTMEKIKADTAVEELSATIATIEKENDEFAMYLK